MSQRLAVLGETVSALSQAAARLAATHGSVSGLFPLAPVAFGRLSEREREQLDAYAIRYARCQDLF
ncbi:MAG: hypothetical protein MUC77_09485 [Chromatiaceae bacterium]|jgi:hypothetical protein|nr:hypothetical protein [Chromatiaceae bacterium]